MMGGWLGEREVCAAVQGGAALVLLYSVMQAALARAQTPMPELVRSGTQGFFFTLTFTSLCGFSR